MDTVQRARRGLGIYLVVLLVVSAWIENQIVRYGLTVSRAFVLMWMPCLASMVARLVMREGIRDVSLRLGRRLKRAFLIAWLYPAGVGAVAYGVAWSVGLVKLEPATEHALGFHIPGDSPMQRFIMSCLVSLTIGPLLGAVFALGEEIGWRGYMLTRLMDAKVPRPVLMSGLIWGIWHVPLILGQQYIETPYPVFSSMIFMVTLIALSYLSARLRLETGSIWPVVILHASWNEFILVLFPGSMRGAHTIIWLGESGIMVAICAVILTAVLVRGSFQWRRSPTELVGTGPTMASL